MAKKMNKGMDYAKDVFGNLGVDVEKAVAEALAIPVSVHCWQGDDVGGFEKGAGGADGGIAVTGNYPGKARTPEELRADFEKVLSFLPGVTRINLHACYAEPVGGRHADRDAITFDNFRNWVDWADGLGIGIDFNPTFFGHPKASDGCPLTNRKKGIRDFWIEHGRRCREIAAKIGAKTKSSVLNNFWTPDGLKDTPADRFGPRKRLADSLDSMFEKEYSAKLTVDAVESKLFGVGCESFTAGSNEFCLGYAISREKLVCLDAGHFHPTEVISDKISSAMLFLKEVALHVSRPVRWDSDHVVTLDDELRAIAQEIVWNGFEKRVRIGLDYFDASINRVAAWTIGARNMRKALLIAKLTPYTLIRKAENAGDYTSRLALQEEFRLLPFGAVWDAVCEEADAGVGCEWLDKCKIYEKEVLSRR
ncbi:MAG: L-rhamnose isomerase [Kiritimatiellia bacterium]|jgi:L-rhamnose isomerase